MYPKARKNSHCALSKVLINFQWWKDVDPDARARILLRAAAILRRRKHEFSATMVMEIGKNWGEADGDTAEAIDFLNAMPVK